MQNESEVERTIGDASVIFRIALNQAPAEASNLDLVLTLSDGSRWSATVLTLAEVNAIWKRWEATGEGLGGRYLNCPDLLLVKEPGIDYLCEVLEGILATEGADGALMRLEDDDDFD